MKKVLLTFGTRPEAIKMAPLVNALKSTNEFHVMVAVTAQHREMLDRVLNLFNIDPDFDLDIMKTGQDLYEVTTSVLTGMRSILEKVNPDMMLVHGDTATTFAASLSAFYSNVKIGHVEAGLRTFNLLSPWPEEANRQLTSRLATLHFAPTSQNKRDLLREGVTDEDIVVTGNTVIDALKWVVLKVETSAQARATIQTDLAVSGLNINLAETKYVLVTGHRRENFGSGFINICKALKDLALKFPNIHFVYPVHLNPNVQKPVRELLSNINNIHLIEPLGYESFVWLMQHSHFILTDSGGVQEEAPGLGKPVLVMRDTTERAEAVEAGTVKLVGTSQIEIIKWASTLLECPHTYATMAKASNPYGDGKACQKIIASLRQKL